MNESASIRLSVIVPCYNVAPWLPRCLDEVLAALPADGEVIAVDDGSDDETLAILRARAQADGRIRVLAGPHRGVSAARNRALDVARGACLFFVDPDDGVEPDFFVAMTEALERDGADCCICAFGERNDGETACRPTRLKGDYRFRSNAEIVAGFLPRIFGYSMDDVRAWYAGKPLFADREMASACRMAYRRELVEAKKIRFDERLSLYEDMVFNATFLLSARAMTCVDRPLYRVTARASGAMRTLPREGLRYCRNKLALLDARDALNRSRGGALTDLYAATGVLSALEILSYLVRGRLPVREGRELLRAYLAHPSVASAVRAFPLSFRRPVLALAVLGLRPWVRCRPSAELL